MSPTRELTNSVYILYSVIQPRLSRMRTLCSPTHNDGGITTCCPPADLPLSEPAIQMPQATFSACFPACSLTAQRATDRLMASQSNQHRNPTQIKSLATYLKRYVIFFPYRHFTPSNVGGYARRPLNPLFFVRSFYDQRSSGITRCGVECVTESGGTPRTFPRPRVL